MLNKWDIRMLELANFVAGWSKDPSTRVGAVIADAEYRIVSTGFNGFPRGVQDKVDVARETKLMRTIHAEDNAILFARRDLRGMRMFVSRPPCANCAAKIIQAGVGVVAYSLPDPGFLARWQEQIDEANAMFWEAGVLVLRTEM